jgi:two-component system, cell cycle sensor histidine kinase and response regulator CckA
MPNSKRRVSKVRKRGDSCRPALEPAQIFRVVAETATDAIITINERSIILFVNEAAERTFGYSVSEMMHHEITMLMPDYLREAHRAALGRYVETGQKHLTWTALRLVGLHRSGKEIPVEVSIGEHVHKGKRIFTGIVRDVSERMKTEAQLRQSEEKYASMIRSSPGAITLRSLPDRRYLEINDGFTRLTGYTAEEVIGKTPADLGLWVDRLPHLRTSEKLEKAGHVEKEEFRFRTKTGEIRYGQVSAVRVTVNEEECMLSVTHDITDSKRAEEALRQSESHFRSLVHDAPYGIYRVTADGRLLQVNPALVKMLGYDSEEELLQRNMGKDVYRDAQAREALVAKHWQNKKDFREVEADWRRKDGKIITVRMTGHVVLGKDNAAAYLEVFAEDITERRTLERQLLQSQKMEAIGRLAGGIAHDFNNLLGVILGHSDILEQHTGSNDRLRKSVEATRNAADRAAALTKQLLGFSRKQIVEPRVMDLNASVSEIEKMLHRVIGEDIELIIRLAPDLGYVKADPGQLSQILMNLTINSRDAMPGGGKLVIETANLELDETYARQHLGARPGRFIMLMVSDTGVGMDSETLSHIFEPFFTTKEIGKGTGLGLSMVYGIVKQSNGYIMAYSEPGHGTTFKIYFPRTEGSLPVQGKQQEIAGGTETILVVEDEPALRELACALLEDSGYTVIESLGVEDALQTAKDPQRRIDLLLTDVVMPGLDGRELASRMAALRPGLRVLYMSGYADDVIVHRGVLVQRTLLVQKPFTKGTLLQKVREALDAQAVSSLN